MLLQREKLWITDIPRTRRLRLFSDDMLPHAEVFQGFIRLWQRSCEYLATTLDEKPHLASEIQKLEF